MGLKQSHPIIPPHEGHLLILYGFKLCWWEVLEVVANALLYIPAIHYQDSRCFQDNLLLVFLHAIFQPGTMRL
jgi:hypothetical protein